MPISSWNWKGRILRFVVLPVIAGILLAGVSVFRGYLHWRAGFDAEGRPIAIVPKKESRRPLSTMNLVTQVKDDLMRVEAAHRSDCRYLSLAHRYSDPACNDDQIDRERQAVRDLARLLSPVDRAPQVTPIDADHLVFRLRLSELGWTDADWDELVRHYQYGLTHAGSADTTLEQADTFIREAVGNPVPLVRADWFVAALARPPLGGPGGTLGLWTKTPPDDIRALAENYTGQCVGLDNAAGELGVEPSRLRDRIAGDEILRDSFGLGPLIHDQTIAREWWESDVNLTSPFQELARRLGLGKPVVRR